MHWPSRAGCARTCCGPFLLALHEPVKRLDCASFCSAGLRNPRLLRPSSVASDIDAPPPYFSVRPPATAASNCCFEITSFWTSGVYRSTSRRDLMAFALRLLDPGGRSSLGLLLRLIATAGRLTHLAHRAAAGADIRAALSDTGVIGTFTLSGGCRRPERWPARPAPARVPPGNPLGRYRRSKLHPIQPFDYLPQ